MADARLVERLRAMLPGTHLRGTPGEGLLEETARLGSKVVLWASLEPQAGLDALLRLRATRPGIRCVFVTPSSAVDERLAALAADVEEVVTEPVADAELPLAWPSC